jgi:hypothetical protein
MAETPAIRMARSRKHAHGDHSLCLPARRPALGGGGRQVLRPPALPTPGRGRVVDAVAGYVEQFEFRENDPRGVSTVVALRLAEALDETGRPSLSLELERILAGLGVLPDDEAGAIEEIRMRRHVQRAVRLLDAARRGDPDPYDRPDEDDTPVRRARRRNG